MKATDWKFVQKMISEWNVNTMRNFRDDCFVYPDHRIYEKYKEELKKIGVSFDDLSSVYRAADSLLENVYGETNETLKTSEGVLKVLEAYLYSASMNTKFDLDKDPSDEEIDWIMNYADLLYRYEIISDETHDEIRAKCYGTDRDGNPCKKEVRAKDILNSINDTLAKSIRIIATKKDLGVKNVDSSRWKDIKDVPKMKKTYSPLSFEEFRDICEHPIDTTSALDGPSPVITDIRTGNYSRKVKTETGPLIRPRRLSTTCQFIKLLESDEDCGTTNTILVKLTEKNKIHYLYRYIYLDNGNLIELTKDNIDIFVGKYIKLRSPMLCRGIGPNHDICKYCGGNLKAHLKGEEKKMEQRTYDVYFQNEKKAFGSDMEIEHALIFASALLEKYYNEPDASITIKLSDAYKNRTKINEKVFGKKGDD